MRLHPVWLAVAVIIASGARPAYSQSGPVSGPSAQGTIVALKGRVEHTPAPQEQWTAARIFQPLLVAERVRTMEASRAAILFIDETQVKLNAGAVLTVREVRRSGGGPTSLELSKGEGWFRTKLIGDAIMVYFGCPIPDERHAVQACRGALEMHRRMTALNARWAADHLPQLTTRIGVNTGRVVAGNMGTETIFNYTIIGDSVNLASRLEGVNQEYGTLTIIGEETWAHVHEAFEVRELDWIRVKGKTRPVTIYELVAEAGRLDERRRDVFGHFAQGLATYREGNWRAAATAFEAALSVDPTDGPSRSFATRCAFYLEHPPAAWDGVHVMTTK